MGKACANVIQHASDSDEYEVRVRVMAARCVIEVVDTGHGFDAITLDDAKGPLTTGWAGRRGPRVHACEL